MVSASSDVLELYSISGGIVSKDFCWRRDDLVCGMGARFDPASRLEKYK